MGWIPDNVVEALRGSHQLGIFLRIETDDPLRVWFGVNDIPASFDSIDPTGTVYLGGGQLIGIPSLEVLVNGTADSVEFTLSGVDPATGADLISSIPAIRGKTVSLGLTTLDEYYQPMSDVIPIWDGIASHTAESSPAVQYGQSPSLTASLSIMTGEATRSRAARSLWSGPQQKAISPTDKFCDETAILARGVNPSWGLGY